MERKEKKQRGNQSLARARLLLRKDLSWVYRFPLHLLGRGRSRDSESLSHSAVASDGIRWLRLDRFFDEQAVFTVDREVLRRSELAASKLRHQFSRATDKLLANPDLWFERFDCLLGHLKEVVHGDQAHDGRLNNLLAEESLRGALSNSTRSARGLSELFVAVRFAELFRISSAGVELDGWLHAAAGPLAALYRDPGQKTELPSTGLCASDFEVLLLIMLRDALRTKEQLQPICSLLTSNAARFLHYPNPNHFISC